MTCEASSRIVHHLVDPERLLLHDRGDHHARRGRADRAGQHASRRGSRARRRRSVPSYAPAPRAGAYVGQRLARPRGPAEAGEQRLRARPRWRCRARSAGPRGAAAGTRRRRARPGRARPRPGARTARPRRSSPTFTSMLQNMPWEIGSSPASPNSCLGPQQPDAERALARGSSRAASPSARTRAGAACRARRAKPAASPASAPSRRAALPEDPAEHGRGELRHRGEREQADRDERGRPRRPARK